jgi:hypothetical protein
MAAMIVGVTVYGDLADEARQAGHRQRRGTPVSTSALAARVSMVSINGARGREPA